MKLEISRHIFEKYLNIKFNENPPSDAELFHADVRTDRQAWWSWQSLFAIWKRLQTDKQIAKPTLKGLPGSHADQYDTESFRFINVWERWRCSSETGSKMNSGSSMITENDLAPTSDLQKTRKRPAGILAVLKRDTNYVLPLHYSHICYSRIPYLHL